VVLKGEVKVYEGDLKVEACAKAEAEAVGLEGEVFVAPLPDYDIFSGSSLAHGWGLKVTKKLSCGGQVQWQVAVSMSRCPQFHWTAVARRWKRKKIWKRGEDVKGSLEMTMSLVPK
jgi:hypothetical protein